MADTIYLNSFIFNGKEYPLNTIVKAKSNIYIFAHKIGKLCDHPMVQIVESFIDWEGVHRWKYAIWLRSGNIITHTTSKSPEDMIECIVGFPPHINNTKTEYYFDWEVHDVQIGWVVFVLIMLLGTFLRDRWTLWIIGSFCFYFWRKAKLKKTIRYAYGFNVEEKVRELNEWKT